MMRFHNHRPHKRHPEWNKLDNEAGFQELFSRHRHGGWRSGHGGMGEGKRRFFERGEFKFALLELLASEPMHGYQMIKAMEERSGGLYTPSAGSIYPNLQLLEDMNLIGSSESDGKKLYQITDEGLTFLQERRKTETEQPEERWERHGRHHRPHGGRQGKRELHGLMKEWSEVIYLMARAAGVAQENPSSKNAKQFEELMAKFKDDLVDVLATHPNASMDEPMMPPTKIDPLPDDNRVDE